ncbi:PepSY domain-containing protein [Sinorhizobium sp. BG8]|uniref:PepSY domain-containing protein n=1 Tax=Sinorhizobium sp. BG8 TaxID=2613773 RepID=UPI00193C9D67|nr:PepSY domain-containing protein [Sinorhizobium sp. BG8]QRM54172.1 peptidase [Sinorhizobium sp. BG8]
MTSRPHHRRMLLRILAACFFLYPVVALSETADDDDDANDAREHYEAREALRLGQIRPLEEIIATVRKEIAGDIIEIEFEREDGRYIYELEIIQPSGQIVEVDVDASTMQILKREED